MNDPTLLGLLHAYHAGDRLARRALLDWLEENGDLRYDAVAEEAIDWEKVTRQLCPDRRRRSRHRWYDTDPEFARFRFYVDCARVGSPTLPEVERAVREARRGWLQGLFPEYDLAHPE
jgi:hypothetical protein